MWEVIAGIVGLATVILGYYFKKRKRRNPRRELLDEIESKWSARQKMSEEEASVDDRNRMRRLNLLLKTYQGDRASKRSDNQDE